MRNEEIVKAIQGGQGNTQALLMQLYKQNLPMIEKVSRKYQRRDQDADDMRQIGFLVLHEAVQKYDPSRGAFITFLVLMLRSRGARSDDDIPAYMRQRITAYSRAETAFRQQYGNEPPDAYFLGTLKINPYELDQLRIIKHRHDLRSLDAPLPGVEDDATLADMVADPEDQIEALCDKLDDEEARRILWAAVDQLDAEQARAIRCRCEAGLTIKETAKRLHMTPNACRNLIEKGRRRLQHDRKVRRVAEDRGYLSGSSVYKGSLARFKTDWSSIVETLALRHLEPENKQSKEESEDTTSEQ